MNPLPTIAECLAQCAAEPTRPTEQLQALDLWLTRRGDATISVGVVSSDVTRRCLIMAHGQTFAAYRRGEGFATSWLAIVDALIAAEQFERATFGDVG